MSRTRKLSGVIGVAVAMTSMTMVGAGGSASASPASGNTAVAGTTASFATTARATGDVAASQKLSIEVWLKPNVAAATSFAGEVSTPGSAQYHQYVSPSSYAARFGATSSQVGAVESWLNAKGFTAVSTDSQHAYVRATATTATIDSAFDVQMKQYGATAAVNAGPYTLRSNDRDVSVPASLAPSVLGVTGLDNAAPATTLRRQTDKVAQQTVPAATSDTGCSQYYGEVEKDALPKQFGTTTFPTEGCGYTATQIRAAYGANTANAGNGQTVALVELGLTPQMFTTLSDYATANHIPAPSARRYSELSLGQGSTCGDPFDTEEQLDVESSYDMVPAANQLVVGGDSCDNGDFGLQGLFDADQAILDGVGNHPLASIASNSWEGGTEDQPASLTQIEHSYLLQAAAEGVGMYFSSADSSGVETPSSDPYAIAVGGTTLGIGEINNRLFETGWSTGSSDIQNKAWALQGEQGAAGGGPSLLWKEPSYQHGVVPAALSQGPGDRGSSRSVPDISADADPYTGFAEGALTIGTKSTTYSESDIGGTSLAAPLVAGMVAAAQQGQTKPFGFVSPALYKLAGTSAINDAPPLTSSSPPLYRGVACSVATCEGLTTVLATFDDQNPNMDGYTGQVTLKGYDNMTGVGTPNGQSFISALRKLAG